MNLFCYEVGSPVWYNGPQLSMPMNQMFYKLLDSPAGRDHMDKKGKFTPKYMSISVRHKKINN